MSSKGTTGPEVDFDVAIVGGRVAGSVLAAFLGRSGHRVLLLEKSHFPSDTLSTHFFRAPALKVFEDLGVLDEVRSAAPALTSMWNYIDGHVFSDAVEGADEHLRFFLCERRITLDWTLHKRALADGSVDVRQGAKVTELLRTAGRVSGVHWKEADGSAEARARVVVGADGFYSTLARLLDPGVEAQSPVQRCMYFTYMRGLAALDGVAMAEHHFLNDSLTYVFPTDGNLTLVAASMPIAEFGAFKHDPLGRLRAHLEALPLLAPRVRKAEVAGEVKGSGNIPCYQRIPFGPGWVLVGDAHQVLDPWSGMGIDHATTHAALLADALNRYLAEVEGWEAAMAGYHGAARKWSEKTYRRTSTYAADLRPMTRAALQKRGLA